MHIDARFAGFDRKIDFELIRFAERIGSAADGQTAGSEHVDFDLALRGGRQFELQSAAVGIVPGGLAVVFVDEAFVDLQGAVGGGFEEEDVLFDLGVAGRF